MTSINSGANAEVAALRISDADRNGTLRRLHNAVALGLIDIDEFEERSGAVSQARLHSELAALVEDLPGPGAIVTTATDRVELRGVLGSLKRQGEWVVPTRLALVRRMGSIDLDLTKARFAGPIVVIELDVKFGSVDIRLPDGASASIDDVEVIVGSARDHRKDAPAEGTPARDPHRPKPLRVDRHPRAAPRGDEPAAPRLTGRVGKRRERLGRQPPFGFVPSPMPLCHEHMPRVLTKIEPQDIGGLLVGEAGVVDLP